MRFKDKIVLITGSAGGIGFKTALDFGNEGAIVAVTDIERWGFRGINYHWGKFRNYTWEEIGGVLYVVRPSEINDLRDISYAYFLTTL